ncbi:EpsG family protein [uncultured Ruminococcus sp.]|uniref:EpsG family protein n=1 Tax=uncultured Ruminococcus sp. TaxID=165186 RepID=UPI0025EB9A1E|nr:EpsG family protein [uncultured Ruminococcus sp.]
MIQLTEIGSYIFYTCMALCSLLFMWLAEHSKKNEKIFLLLSFLVIAIPSVFRYRTGIDYNGYIEVYNKYVQLGSIAVTRKWYTVEPTFLLLCALSHKLTGTPIVAFGFYSVATAGFMISGIWYFRKYAKPTVSLLMYLGIYYFHSYNIFRQMLAIAIVFWGIRYIIERKPVCYFLVVGVAVLFHSTAILAVILYWYGTKKSTAGKFLRVFNYLGPILITVLLPIMINLLLKLPVLARYAKAYGEVKTLHIGLGYIIDIVGVILFFYALKKRNLCSEKKKIDYSFDLDYFWKQIIVLGVILDLLQYNTGGYIGRISLYFTVPTLIPYASLYCKKRTRKLTFYIEEVYPICVPIILFAKSILTNAQEQIPYIAKWLF